MTYIEASSEFDAAAPAGPLRPTGNLWRRLALSRALTWSATLAALAAVTVLVVVTYAVTSRGAGALSLGFLTKDPPQFGGSGGGIRSAVVGTTMIVALATVIAAPLGVLIAVYLVEFCRPTSRAAFLLRLALDLLQGLPSVVVGLFILGLVVEPQRSDSGFAGSLALAIIMLPLIARAGEGVLQAVPASMREAADALGVQRWRSLLTVVLPHARAGMLTGIILAVARAAGETAPLLIVDGIFTNATTLNLFGHPVPNIPVSIWTAAEAADPSGFTRAWGEALVLLGVILIANVVARLIVARSRRRLGP